MGSLPISEQVRQALAEDCGSGDITAQLIDAQQTAQARIITREPCVLCGTDWVTEVFKQVDPNIQCDWQSAEGEEIHSEQILCELHGTARGLLTGERTALNFLQTLSATATATRHYVQALAGYHTQLLDTRKTLPGWRAAQKYAVRMGGGKNHRQGLYDQFLIKENHIEACGGIEAAIQQARQQQPNVGVGIEVETLSELSEALHAGADHILCDNFTPTQLQEAVAINQNRASLEASGNINLTNLEEIAGTGIDFISVGTITKHIQAIDLSLRFLPTKSVR